MQLKLLCSALTYQQVCGVVSTQGSETKWGFDRRMLVGERFRLAEGDPRLTHLYGSCIGYRMELILEDALIVGCLMRYALCTQRSGTSYTSEGRGVSLRGLGIVGGSECVLSSSGLL
jgi:hypothetical protein